MLLCLLNHPILEGKSSPKLYLSSALSRGTNDVELWYVRFTRIDKQIRVIKDVLRVNAELKVHSFVEKESLWQR